MYILQICICCLYIVFFHFTIANAEVSENITKEISFLFFNGKTIYDYQIIPYNNGISILDLEQYDNTKKTVIYLHGWSERPTHHGMNYSTDTIAEAFVQSQSVNLIIVDYSNLVQQYYNLTSWTPPMVNMGLGYAQAVQNATQIGEALGKFFQIFVTKCQCNENLHIIGFSLGAHIMSYAAVVYGKGQLKRLTALDAAGPIFEIPGHSGLHKSDGSFVDVIHTDAGVLGYFGDLGDVDFYPNQGIGIQPHCAIVGAKCNHYMSVQYYAESVNNAKSFKARQCSNSIIWTTGLCNQHNTTYMGYHVDTSTSGKYYLRTNANPPYGMGENGL